jgi:hypothetical protein
VSAKKIPPDIEPELLGRAGRGESGDELAAWLDQAHGIKVSGRRVRAFLEEKRREREPIARAAIVKVVSETVAADLQALDELATEARALLEIAKLSGNLFAAIQAISVEKSVRETRLKLSGGSEPDQPPGGGRAATAVILLPPERRIELPALPAPAPVTPEKKP